MRKLLPAFALLVAPLAAFSQAGIKINGTTPVYIVMAQATPTTPSPIYIEINNPSNTGFWPVTGNDGWVISENEDNMVKWDITQAGITASSGAYIIPFGYSTGYYLPLFVNLSSIGTPSANGGMLFSTWHTQGDNWTGTPSVNGPPTGVNNMDAMYNTPNAAPGPTDDSYQVVDRFWVMDATAYSTAPSVSSALYNGVTFTYIGGSLLTAPAEDISPNVFNQSNLLAQRYNPSGTWGDWLGQGSNYAGTSTTGTISTGIISSGNFFRSWTLSDDIDPLPVNISSFTTQCDNGSAYIQWTAQSQLNNASFTLKKSSDNIHFETVGTLAGAGTTDQAINYSLIDNSPFGGTSYYYLYQTNTDNTVNLVQTTQFVGCGTQDITTVNGYNTTNFVVVDINSVDYSNYQISLVNMLGQTVYDENHSVALGENEIHLPNMVAAGIYILSVRNDKVNYTKKLVVGVR